MNTVRTRHQCGVSSPARQAEGQTGVPRPIEHQIHGHAALALAAGRLALRHPGEMMACFRSPFPTGSLIHATRRRRKSFNSAISAACEFWSGGDQVQRRKLRSAASPTSDAIPSTMRSRLSAENSPFSSSVEARPISRPEVRIAKQQPPTTPRRSSARPWTTTRPLLGLGGARVVRCAEAAIEIPHGTRHQTAAPILVKVRAEAHPVDVLGQHVDDVVIDPGIDVDELRVVLARGRMPEVRGARGLPEAVDEARG